MNGFERQASRRNLLAYQRLTQAQSNRILAKWLANHEESADHILGIHCTVPGAKCRIQIKANWALQQRWTLIHIHGQTPTLTATPHFPWLQRKTRLNLLNAHFSLTTIAQARPTWGRGSRFSRILRNTPPR